MGPSTSTSKATPSKPTGGSVVRRIVRFFTLTVCNILFMLIGAFVIHQYDPSVGSSKANSQFMILSHKLSVPIFLAQPSLPVFLFACVFYLSALSSFPVPPNEDIYQIHFLALGALAAHIGTTKFGWNEKYLVVMKSFLPTTVTVALVLSLMFHSILRSRGPGIDSKAKDKPKENKA